MSEEINTSTEFVPGYPNLGPKWKKGERPAGAGKPVGVKNRSTVLKTLLDVKLKAKGLDGEEGSFSAEYLANAALLRKAMEGDVQAYKELHDTVYGKNTDNQKITGDMQVSWPLPQSKLDE